MQPRPKIYTDILIWGGRSSSEATEVPRIGGLFGQPDLGLSYLLAARHVIEAGDREGRLRDVAVPVAYLQRHALEIALKSVLAISYEISCDTSWVERLQTDRTARRGAVMKVPLEHDLAGLRRKLRAALKVIGFGDLPNEILAVTEEVRAAEEQDPTRFRYLTLKSGKPSFPKEVPLRVAEMQAALEDVFERFFAYQGLDADDGNLVTTLLQEAEALQQAILRIVPIDEL